MRFHDPFLPKSAPGEPRQLTELKRAIYESERRRAGAPTFTLGDGTTDRAVYDYLKFAGTDVTTTGSNGILVTAATRGTWTPVDASGAGLTFAAASGTYVRFPIGLVVIQGAVTYPATASGLQAYIGGLPFTVGTNAVGSSYNTSGVAITALAIGGFALVTLLNAATGAAITNAQMTGANLVFTISYEE